MWLNVLLSIDNYIICLLRKEIDQKLVDLNEVTQGQVKSFTNYNWIQ